MPNTKVKIQFDDGEGGHYSISLNGKVTREKVEKIINIYSLFEEKVSLEQNNENADTLYNRILNIINNKFKNRQFTSYDIQEAYEDSYNEPIKLAVISTYLSRFNIHGHLNRYKDGRLWIYTNNYEKTNLRTQNYIVDK